MAGEVQFFPHRDTVFCGCPSAPSLLMKLQEPLLPLGFLLGVRGTEEAAMQLPLPWDQPRGAGAQNLTWQPGRWRDLQHVASPSLRTVRHGAGGRWFAGRTNQPQALAIS